MSGSAEYRGYLIAFDPLPIPVRTCDWSFVHRDFDGEGDSRYGRAETLAEAKEAIDYLIEEEAA
jgi:hypothetical protein